MAVRRARARRARFECGVGAARARARLRRSVEVVDADRLRFFDGVWGTSARSASGCKRSAYCPVYKVHPRLRPCTPHHCHHQTRCQRLARPASMSFSDVFERAQPRPPKEHRNPTVCHPPRHVRETASGGKASQARSIAHAGNLLHLGRGNHRRVYIAKRQAFGFLLG
jgi:hypothetical protein